MIKISKKFHNNINSININSKKTKSISNTQTTQVNIEDSYYTLVKTFKSTKIHGISVLNSIFSIQVKPAG
jgi:hypothetical protein